MDNKKITIEKSDRKNKKYKAIVDGKVVHFGDTRYEQYKDSTKLKLYSNLDHKDEKRRENYYKRHNKDYPIYSADYFSKKYLW